MTEEQAEAVRNIAAELARELEERRRAMERAKQVQAVRKRLLVIDLPANAKHVLVRGEIGVVLALRSLAKESTEKP
ncbi:MAG: hypothetical protein K2X38_02045 [Gemmataceae bacterium]|nr:hypothetical protein [Gemmataceae bacterium]